MDLPFRFGSNLTGLVLSGACVVHCMAMPLCLASLSSSGFGWLASPWVHQVLAILGVVIGLWALLPGWREHRRHYVVAIAAFGLSIMNYQAFAGDECCAEPVAEEAPACGHSCCPPKSATPSPPPAEVTASLAPPAVLAWLGEHPTAFGAGLLFLAHLLNGRCRCAGCNLPTGGSEGAVSTRLESE